MSINKRINAIYLFILPIAQIITRLYNINILNKREVTSMGKTITQKIVTDIEDIKYESDTLVGLSTVLTSFCESALYDENILNVFVILMEETFKMQDKCNALMKFAHDEQN